MNEEPGRRWRIVAPLLLLTALGAGVLLQPMAADSLQLATADRSMVREIGAQFDALPARGLVVVGMDGDLGTYPEIRATTRAAFADLLDRGARLAFVSFSPEGRAISAAEQARLQEGGTPEGAVLDLGFVAGAEAGLVRSVSDVLPPASAGPLADAIADGGGGLAAFDLAMVIGGVDMGARSWVEQVGTRLPELPVVAIAPTYALPELLPYLRTGQLAGLLATVRDGAAYVGAVPGADEDAELAANRPPPALAMLLGMLLAVAVLGRLVWAGLVAALRATRSARAR